MTAKNPTPATKPNVSQAKVKKVTPPVPEPHRPAMGTACPGIRPQGAKNDYEKIPGYKGDNAEQSYVDVNDNSNKLNPPGKTSFP